MPKKCLTCKSSNDIPTEEIPYWSKKKGNYTPYPKMITCDERYSLQNKDEFFGRDEYSNSVIVKTKENLKGKIKEVQIKGGNQNTLFGEINKNQNKRNFAA